MSRKIAYYITAHGYGHAVRSSYLINELGKSCDITILTDIPQSFFEEELQVPFAYRAAIFDCGCVQKDAVTLDSDATEREYYHRSVENDSLRDAEVAWIQKMGIELVISDLVPYAGVLAYHAKVPAVTVSNFWWDDIYRSFPESKAKQWLVHRVEGEMTHFTHHVILNPVMKKWEVGNEILSGVNLLREARDRSDELHDYFEIDKSLKIALLYTGNYGMGEVHWDKLENIEGWHFIGLHEIPGNPANFTLVTKENMTMQEFTASVDVVISKLGYGTVTESLATGTPILYLPREGFAEFPVLEEYLMRYKHCERIEYEPFNSIEWQGPLDKLAAGGKRSLRLSSDTIMIAEWILSIPRP